MGVALREIKDTISFSCSTPLVCAFKTLQGGRVKGNMAHYTPSRTSSVWGLSLTKGIH